MQWKPISDDMPRTAVLLWAGGYCMVGCRVCGDPGESAVFMDPRTDSILPTPSHWTELPRPPMPAGVEMSDPL